MNKHIEEYLSFYLDLKKPGYAVLLDGKWGCGKTYFIDKYIEHKQNKKFVKISLFGLKNITDIDEMIFYQLYPIFDNRLVKVTSGVLKTAVKLGIKLDIDGNKQHETTIAPKLDKLDLVDFFNKNKNLDDDIIFVFDDLERTKINFSIILGYINHLTEQSGFKTILIANTEEINNENKEVFQSFNEKVIGPTFEVSHDFDNVLNDFLEKNNELLCNHKTSIKAINLTCKNKNLRTVKQIIDDFKFLANIIESKYLENDDFVEQLIRQFFFLSIYQKNNQAIEESIKKMSSEDQMYDLFSDEIWQEILEKRTINCSLLNSLISDLIFFRKEIKKENPEWVKLWRYRTLEDKDFTKLLNTVINKFKNYEYMDIQVFLHVVGLLIHFIKNNMTKLTINEIKNVVDATLNKKTLKPKNDMWGLRSSALGMEYYEYETADFNDIQTKLDDYNKNLLTQKQANQIANYENIIISEMLSNNYEFTEEILYTEKREIAIFHQFSVNKFIQNLNNASNESLITFGRIINSRYSDRDYLNGNPYYFYLKDELTFWIDFESQLNTLIKSISTDLPIKRNNLNLLLNESQNIIKKLQNS